MARRTDAEGAAVLAGVSSIEVLSRSDGAWLALFPDAWRASKVARDHPDIMLEQLPASG